jgi:leucyl-tRNA synthetase
VTHKEPYKKRTTQGLILGSDGEKMSKSRGNVVDPIGIIEESGADTLRTYILFIGEYEQSTPWSEQGIKGCRRFIERVYRLLEKVNDGETYTPVLEKSIHKAIKEVSYDIENSKFNTAISKLMSLSNEYYKQEAISRKDLMTLIQLYNPFAPHVCEEINELLGNTTPLVFSSWPIYEEALTHDDEVEVAVQVNGKLRGTFKVAKDSDRSVLESNALALDSVQAQLIGKVVRKIIVVPNKIVNIVI